MAEGTATHDVTAETFPQAVMEASKERLIIVDFWAPWCPPCRALGPVLERVVGEFAAQATLVKVNTDEQQALATQWAIRSIPAVKAFRNGAVVDEFVGFQPEPQLREWLESLIGTSQR